MLAWAVSARAIVPPTAPGRAAAWLALVLAASCGRERTFEHPAPAPSRLPRFACDAGGRVALSWVEERAGDEGAAVLRLSWLRDREWTAPVEVARGERWFVNWADFPALALLSPDVAVASFLERTGDGPFDYRAMLARSADAGRTWGERFRLHDDAGPGEHGFVSFAPSGGGACVAVWLDGRNAGDGHGDASGGAMALYAREIRLDGSLGNEVAVDERVCDCCATAAACTDSGATLIAYRDREEDERRDIAIARLDATGAPARVWDSADGWKIAGCPVNGPALAASGERAGVAWFTLGSEGAARVRCATSGDGGRSFSAPIEVAGGAALGRVDAVFDAQGRLAVLWLEAQGFDAEWRIARIGDEGRAGASEPVAPASGDRSSGFARLVRDGDRLLVAWTSAGDPPRVKVAELP
jgi:hypothetical protein